MGIGGYAYWPGNGEFFGEGSAGRVWVRRGPFVLPAIGLSVGGLTRRSGRRFLLTDRGVFSAGRGYGEEPAWVGAKESK